MNAINVLIFLLAVFLASEAGHHERRHRFHERGAANSTNDDEVEDDNSDWPNVAEVKHFKIPDVFTRAKSTHQADDESEDNNEVHHHGRHHGVHRH